MSSGPSQGSNIYQDHLVLFCVVLEAVMEVKELESESMSF